MYPDMFRVFPAVLTFLIFGLFSGDSYAYKERPFDWSSSVDTDLSAVFDSHDESNANLLSPLISENAIQSALDDRDHRINPLFAIPRELRSSVSLWLRVYTEFTTQHVVLFDGRHPEIIYDVLDFRPLAESAKSKLVYEIMRERQIKTAVAKYRSAFGRLSRNPHPRSPTPEEKKVLAAVRKASHKHGFASLSHTFRTQTGQRDNIVRGLGKADPLFNKMEAIFASVGIPAELSRLVLVESSFNTNVVSSAGATGVWQFLEPSAREFMIVDHKMNVDERLSPIKSTVAAARLLQRNFKLLHDWGLAITSYNSGTKPLLGLSRRIPKSAMARKVFSYCDGTHTLGFAGKSYYPSFLAILHAESYRDFFFGRPNRLPEPTKMAYFRLGKSQSALDFGIEHGLSLHEFIRINPDVRNIKRPLPEGYWLAVPSQAADSFGGLIAENLNSLQLDKKRRSPRRSHKISMSRRRHGRTTLMTSGETRTSSDHKI